MELRKPGRGRRRKIILGSVIAVVVSAVALPIVSSGAANGPSSDINDYVLYSMSTITLKHGASIGGNVAAGTTNWQTPAGCTTPVAAGTNEYTFNHEMLKSYTRARRTGATATPPAWATRTSACVWVRRRR